VVENDTYRPGNKQGYTKLTLVNEQSHPVEYEIQETKHQNFQDELPEESYAFSNANYGDFIDPRDDRQYGWVKLDNLIWMTENLAYIPPENESYWTYQGGNVSGSYEYLNTYGILYGFKTALKSCPPGWRVPTDIEWSKLERHLDNTIIDLNQISYRGTTIGSQLVSIRQGSLKANFGGKRLSNGNFVGYKSIGSYWTSSRADNFKAWNRQIQRDLPQIIRQKGEENEGNSVRCVRNIK
jgi:uncharacterized protein (TIGR02145 family)